MHPSFPAFLSALKPHQRQAKPLFASARRCDWHFFAARVRVSNGKRASIRLLHEMQLNYLHASIILFIVCRRTRTHSLAWPAIGKLFRSRWWHFASEWGCCSSGTRPAFAARQKRPWALRASSIEPPLMAHAADLAGAAVCVFLFKKPITHCSTLQTEAISLQASLAPTI